MNKLLIKRYIKKFYDHYEVVCLLEVMGCLILKIEWNKDNLMKL